MALQPTGVAHQLRAPRGQAAQQPRALIRNPHPRHEVRGEQLRERARVHLVVLDPGLIDRPQPARVGDHHLADVRLQDLRDRQRVARRLQHDPVIAPKAPREQLQLRPRRLDPPRRAGRATLGDRDLAEVLVDV
jgi:hypothetical protein